MCKKNNPEDETKKLDMDQYFSPSKCIVRPLLGNVYWQLSNQHDN